MDYNYYQEVEKAFWNKDARNLKEQIQKIVDRIVLQSRKRCRKSKHPRWERPRITEY